MKKSSKVALIFAFLVSIFVPVAAFADEIGDVVAPTGIMALVVIIPLIVVLVLLFMKVDMIIAGLIGGVLAMLIGGIGLEEANKQMLEAIPMMLGITVPIINSAVAMAVFKAGSYSAALTLAKRGTKGKVEYVSAFIVILLAAATYMSGIGGGSAMVIAPLAFAAVGVVPEVIFSCCGIIYNITRFIRIKYCFKIRRYQCRFICFNHATLLVILRSISDCVSLLGNET